MHHSWLVDVLLCECCSTVVDQYPAIFTLVPTSVNITWWVRMTVQLAELVARRVQQDWSKVQKIEDAAKTKVTADMVRWRTENVLDTSQLTERAEARGGDGKTASRASGAGETGAGGRG